MPAPPAPRTNYGSWNNNVKCFNCGGGHTKRYCRKPIDVNRVRESVAKWRREHPGYVPPIPFYRNQDNRGGGPRPYNNMGNRPANNTYYNITFDTNRREAGNGFYERGQQPYQNQGGFNEDRGRQQNYYGREQQDRQGDQQRYPSQQNLTNTGGGQQNYRDQGNSNFRYENDLATRSGDARRQVLCSHCGGDTHAAEYCPNRYEADRSNRPRLREDNRPIYEGQRNQAGNAPNQDQYQNNDRNRGGPTSFQNRAPIVNTMSYYEPTLVDSRYPDSRYPQDF